MAQIPARSLVFTEEDDYKLPEDVRAELIGGQFYVMSAPSRIHQQILNYLNTEINIYIRSKGGPCRVYPAPFAVKLSEDARTVVEPDISVICDPAKLTDRGCTGAPDWGIEISSPGNPWHDYIRKLNLYAEAGVREYWIVDPMKKTVLVYHLSDPDLGTDIYTFQDKVKAGIYEDLQIDFDELDLT